MTITDEELYDYVDGFIAWDSGCQSSGIKDDVRREQVIEQLSHLSDVELMHFFFNFWKNRYTTPPNDGYGFESLVNAVRWFNENLKYDY